MNCESKRAVRIEFKKSRCSLVESGTILSGGEKVEECFDELSIDGKHLSEIICIRSS
jgi:hypothetical protein